MKFIMYFIELSISKVLLPFQHVSNMVFMCVILKIGIKNPVCILYLKSISHCDKPHFKCSVATYS